MIERANAFDFLGPRTLVGPALQVGDPAPDFALVNAMLATETLASFAGKPLVLSVVPSLDTSVCSKQSLRFNEAATTLADRVSFVTVSADLPWAQARWCSSNQADFLQTLSDHRELSFGQSYGTYLSDFRIESRAVFVVDATGVIRYAEYVPTAGQEPDYAAALAALEAALA